MRRWMVPTWSLSKGYSMLEMLQKRLVRNTPFYFYFFSNNITKGKPCWKCCNNPGEEHYLFFLSVINNISLNSSLRRDNTLVWNHFSCYATLYKFLLNRDRDLIRRDTRYWLVGWDAVFTQMNIPDWMVLSKWPPEQLKCKKLHCVASKDNFLISSPWL